MLSVLAVALGACWAYTITVKRLHRRNRELERAVGERTSSLAQANSQLKALLQATEEKTEQVEAARIQAECATRAQREFLANVSHEIRTPMNGILGMLDLALASDPAAEQQEYLDLAKESAESLLALLNGLLDYSKIESGRLELDPRDFSLGQCLKEVARSLSAQATQKGLSLTCRVQPGTPDALTGDTLRLRQILMNLIGNGIKFTDSGGVVVEVRCDSISQTEAILFFSVADTGIGIPADRQKVIFEAFRQAEASTFRNYGGTGLGLAISRRLVELMGGHIWVDSETGRGSTFRFTVRMGIQGPQVVAVGGSSGASDRPRENRRIPPPPPTALRALIVEDNPVNQRLASWLLAKRGHSAAIAANGREALDILDRSRFDLILMDVQMPVMDGLTATAAIRNREKLTGKHVPIIAMTACASEEDKQNCLSTGMDAYVSKPISAEELFAVVAEVTSRRDQETTVR